MQARGARRGPSNSLARMPATDDEIREKYLERAIRELNGLTREVQACEGCPRGHLAPVLASGHPLADIFMLKHSPSPSEVHEGVAFYGRSGQAVLKSLRRLGIDPLVVYGTLAIKCPVADAVLSTSECRAHVLTELAIVQPRIVVVMGEPALAALNELEVPLGRELAPLPGEIQTLTPTCDALYVPDIDGALDKEDAKRDFWAAFRALGDWYAELPPY
jgi:uracil-DNA glycosylase